MLWRRGFEAFYRKVKYSLVLFWATWLSVNRASLLTFHIKYQFEIPLWLLDFIQFSRPVLFLWVHVYIYPRKIAQLSKRMWNKDGSTIYNDISEYQTRSVLIFPQETTDGPGLFWGVHRFKVWSRICHGPLTTYVKLRVAHAPGMPGTFSPPPKPLVSHPGMHHGTCVTHVPWCMSGSLTHGGQENVLGIPNASTIHNLTYLARGTLCVT